MKHLFAFVSAILVFSRLIATEDCPTMFRSPQETSRFGRMRLQAIRGWDKLLTWALTPKNTKYPHVVPPVAHTFSFTSYDVTEFIHNYGYFATDHPIVGIVTENQRDIQLTNCLLSAVSRQIKDPHHRQFVQDEILAKVVAYRSLQKGAKVDMGNVAYTVDEVIDLWKGMPAFGLVPNNPSFSPILLYRGTNLNIVSEKGWASILSDLDINGPGHNTYLTARQKIRQWLMKMQNTPPRVIGYSLGGVFTLYNLIHDHDLITKNNPSIAFNPPGVSKEMLEKWQAIPDKHRPQHITYVHKGDFVSKIGFFLANLWEVSTPKKMGVIEAHVSLMTAEPDFTLSQVDLEMENSQRQ